VTSKKARSFEICRERQKSWSELFWTSNFEKFSWHQY